MLEKNLPKTISPNEAYYLIEGLVGEDDRFVYNCAVGSAKRTLKCFEYKLTEEIVNHGEEIDEWLSNMDLITQAYISGQVNMMTIIVIVVRNLLKQIWMVNVLSVKLI